MTIARSFRRFANKKSTKRVARKVYKATGLVNPYKKGRLSTTRLVKDVKWIKSVLNPEKKQAPSLSLAPAVGQCNGNTYGNYFADITPIISQGVTGQTRNGVSVRLHSMCIKGQILQQSANHFQGKIKFEIFINKGNLNASASIADIYSVNPITGLYDINSPRALDTFKGFRRLLSRTFSLKQDNYSGVQGWRDITIPIRFKSHHVKYNDDNSNNVTNGQILLVITCDGGNMSAVTASSNGAIPVTAVSTGYQTQMYINSWFYDN